jgi:hypothetical protein
VSQPPVGYQNVMPYGNFSIPPPQPEIQYQAVAPPIEQPTADNGDCMNLMREAELSSNLVNWKPKESSDPSGSDLPLTDVPTLQFYYNLGVRYFLASGVQRRLENVATQLETLEISESGEKTEPPPVPTNTPVTTKSNYSQPPNQRQQHHQGGNNNFRRQGGNGNYRGNWNNNGNGNGGPRKEIRFNSNVKNVHKNDPKTSNVNTGTASTQTGKAKDATPKIEKLSPSSQYSPLSPVATDVQAQYQQVEYQQPPPQAFYQYPQTFVPQQQVQQGIGICQVNEDGSYTMMPPTYRE